MRIVASASLILALVAVDTADAATKAKPRLKAFSSCQSLVKYARAGAMRTDGGDSHDTKRTQPVPQRASRAR